MSGLTSFYSHLTLTHPSSSHTHLLTSSLVQLSEQMAAPRLFRFIILSLQVVSCFFFFAVLSKMLWAFQLSCHVFTWKLQLKYMSTLSLCGSYNFNSLCRAHRNIKLRCIKKWVCACWKGDDEKEIWSPKTVCCSIHASFTLEEVASFVFLQYLTVVNRLELAFARSHLLV